MVKMPTLYITFRKKFRRKKHFCTNFFMFYFLNFSYQYGGGGLLNYRKNCPRSWFSESQNLRITKPNPELVKVIRFVRDLLRGPSMIH